METRNLAIMLTDIKGFTSKTAAAALLVAVAAGDAHAYLDPGAGSYAFQVIAALLLGAVFAVKMFFKDISVRIKKLFRRGG